MSASKPNQSHHSPNKPKKNPNIIYEVTKPSSVRYYPFRELTDLYKWQFRALQGTIKALWMESSSIKLHIRKNIKDRSQKVEIIQRYVTRQYNNRNIQDITGGKSKYKKFLMIFAASKEEWDDVDEELNYFLITTGEHTKSCKSDLTEGEQEFVDAFNEHIMEFRKAEERALNELKAIFGHKLVGNYAGIGNNNNDHIFHRSPRKGGRISTRRVKKRI